MVPKAWRRYHEDRPDSEIDVTPILSWLARNYVGVSKYILSTAVAVLVAVLGSALPQVRWTSRVPARLAATVGAFLVAIGVLAGVGKLAWPSSLKPMAWAAPAIAGVLGFAFIGVAWVLRKQYRRRSRQRLQPMIEAALRTLDRASRATAKHPYVELRNPGRRPVVGEILTAVRRRRPGGLILLVGPGGAGKTTVLLELAARCRLSWEERNRRVVIPVYANLSQWGDEVSEIPLRAFVLRELTSDDQLSRLFADAWSVPQPDVTWLFLLDNVDTMLKHSAADDFLASLDDFLAINKNLRAVLAGLSGSSRKDAVRIDIAPLDRRSRDHLLTSRGVAKPQQVTLNSEKSFRQYYGNPGWLDLIATYLIKRPGMVTDNFYELMAEITTQQLALKRPAPGQQLQDLLLSAADETAALLASRIGSAIPTRREQVLQYLIAKLNKDQPEIEPALDALISRHIMKSYRASNGSDCVEFEHDAIQDYFTIRTFINHSSAVNIATLLTDPRWSTVAISLVQHGSDEAIAETITSARKILNDLRPQAPATTMVVNRLLKSMQLPERPIVQENISGPQWSPIGYRVLYILDAGSQRRPLLMPEDIRELTDFFIASAIPTSTPDEQAQMLDVQHIAQPDVAAAVCAAGLRSVSGGLVDSALAEVTTRHEVMDALPLKDRIRVMLAISVGGLDNWTLHDVKPEFAERLRLASDTGVVASWLAAIIFGFVGLVQLVGHIVTWASYLTELGFAAIVVGGVIMTRKSAWAMKGALARGVRLPYVVVIGLMALGFLSLLSVVLGVLTGNYLALTGLPLAAMLWPGSTLFYLANETRPDPRKWRLPFGAIMLPIWNSLNSPKPSHVTLPSKRKVLEAARTVILVAAAIAFVVLIQKGSHFHGMSRVADHRLHVALTWLAGVIFCASLCVLPAADLAHDWRRMRHWMAPTTSNPSVRDVLKWMEMMRTTWGTIRMIAEIEQHTPAEVLSATEFLTDLYRALEWIHGLGIKGKKSVPERDWAAMPQLGTPELGDWLKAYDGRHPGRLDTIARRHRHRLADYLLASSSVSVGYYIPQSPIAPEKES
jgi:hypothetical protein